MESIGMTRWGIADGDAPTHNIVGYRPLGSHQAFSILKMCTDEQDVGREVPVGASGDLKAAGSAHLLRAANLPPTDRQPNRNPGAADIVARRPARVEMLASAPVAYEETAQIKMLHGGCFLPDQVAALATARTLE